MTYEEINLMFDLVITKVGPDVIEINAFCGPDTRAYSYHVTIEEGRSIEELVLSNYADHVQNLTEPPLRDPMFLYKMRAEWWKEHYASVLDMDKKTPWQLVHDCLMDRGEEFEKDCRRLRYFYETLGVTDGNQ